MQCFCMKFVQYNDCLVNSVDTDGMVHRHQGINIYIADYAPTCFQLLIG